MRQRTASESEGHRWLLQLLSQLQRILTLCYLNRVMVVKSQPQKNTDILHRYCLGSFMSNDAVQYLRDPTDRNFGRQEQFHGFFKCRR